MRLQRVGAHQRRAPGPLQMALPSSVLRRSESVTDAYGPAAAVESARSSGRMHFCGRPGGRVDTEYSLQREKMILQIRARIQATSNHWRAMSSHPTHRQQRAVRAGLHKHLQQGQGAEAEVQLLVRRRLAVLLGGDSGAHHRAEGRVL